MPHQSISDGIHQRMLLIIKPKQELEEGFPQGSKLTNIKDKSMPQQML